MVVIAGAKVYKRIRCFLKETRKASYSWYNTISSPLTLSCPYGYCYHFTLSSCDHISSIILLQSLTQSHDQVGLTPSRRALQRNSPLNPSIGSTSALLPSPATSTSAKPSVLADFERSTAQLATVAPDHLTMLTLPEVSTARSCKR